MGVGRAIPHACTRGGRLEASRLKSTFPVVPALPHPGVGAGAVGQCAGHLESGHQDTFVNYDNDDRPLLFISGGEDYLVLGDCVGSAGGNTTQARFRGDVHDAPRPAVSIAGITARASLNAPVRFVPRMRSQVASDVSWAGEKSSFTPATFARPSMREPAGADDPVDVGLLGDVAGDHHDLGFRERRHEVVQAVGGDVDGDDTSTFGGDA
jgi:hypothetical protein